MNAPVESLLTPLMGWLLSHMLEDSFDGISLCDINHDDKDDERFYKCVKKALTIIRAYDPRRYRRVQQYVQHIVNVDMLSLAQYLNAIHVCELDYGRIVGLGGRSIQLWCTAGAIVHEATHGLAADMGARYVGEGRVGAERLCHREQMAFLRRAPKLVQGRLIYPFNPRLWEYYWSTSRWRQFRDATRHQRELRRGPRL